MNISMLASHLLQVLYVGSEDYGKVAFDADGGTAAGQLTLTEGDDATAYDLGDAANDALEKLHQSIYNDGSWHTYFPLCFNGANSVKTVAFTQRPLNDVSEVNAERGLPVKVLEFQNAYESMPANGENDFQTAMLMDVRGCEKIAVTLHVTGADPGAAGRCHLFMQSLAFTGSVAKYPGSSSSDGFMTAVPAWQAVDWDNGAVLEEPISVMLDGANEVVVTKIIDVDGIDFIAPKSFENNDDAKAKVKIFIS